MDPGHRQFFYYAPCLGSVQTLYQIGGPGSPDRRLYVDVLPHDLRGPIIHAPVFCVAGGERQLRLGMTVLVFFVDGNPQFPVVLGHSFNVEPSQSLYHDPIPDAHENIDDHVFSHEETGFFSRVRSYQSTPTKAAPDGSPAQLDVEFQSGATLNVYEYPPDGYTPPPATQTATPPPPPTRARVTLTMPSSLSVTLDEPTTGQSTVDIEHPSGAFVSIDVDGNITVSSPATMTLDADEIILDSTNVQVGEDGSGGKNLAFNEDLVTLTNAFNAHVHPGVASGGSSTSPTTSTVTPATGTTDTEAE